MTSGFRTRRIPRERSLGLSSAPSTRLPSASPSPVKRWSGIPGRMAAPLRSLLLVFSLVLVGYVTWKEVFSTGDSSLSYKLPSESTGASSPSYQVASESTGASSFSHEVLLSESSPKRRTALYSIEVVKEYRHDPDAFTQGLLYAGNDTLFESTGLYGHSSVRKVLLQTGKVKTINRMDSSFFGEGLTLLGDRLFQVAWRTRTGFIYDRHSLKKLKKFTHQMEDGWGLATDGKVIFGSDGSSTLYHLDPQTLKVIKSTIVKYNDQAVFDLNELEFIDGEIWANLWQTDCIARISYEDGKVLGWILLHGLRESLIQSGHREVDVLNGIAWDQENGRIFVTGKLWPKLYEIKVRELTHPLNGAVEDVCQLRLF